MNKNKSVYRMIALLLSLILCVSCGVTAVNAIEASDVIEPELLDTIAANPNASIQIFVERKANPLTVEDMPSYDSADRASLYTARKELAAVNREKNQEFIEELGKYASFTVDGITNSTIVVLTIKARDIYRLAESESVFTIESMPEGKWINESEDTAVEKLSEELQKAIEETDDPDALIEVIAYGSFGLSLDKKTKLELLDTPGEHGFTTKLQEMVVQFYRENNAKLFEEIQTVSPKAVQIKKAGSYCFVSNERKMYYSCDGNNGVYMTIPKADVEKIAKLNSVRSITLYKHLPDLYPADSERLQIGGLVVKVAEESNEYGLYDVLLFKSVSYRGEKVIVRLGDVDNDGELTVIDATGIQRELAGIGSTEFIEDCADYDRDDNVSVLDATAIQRTLAE